MREAQEKTMSGSSTNKFSVSLLHWIFVDEQKARSVYRNLSLELGIDRKTLEPTLVVDYDKDIVVMPTKDMTVLTAVSMFLDYLHYFTFDFLFSLLDNLKEEHYHRRYGKGERYGVQSACECSILAPLLFTDNLDDAVKGNSIFYNRNFGKAFRHVSNYSVIDSCRRIFDYCFVDSYVPELDVLSHKTNTDVSSSYDNSSTMDVFMALYSEGYTERCKALSSLSGTFVSIPGIVRSIPFSGRKYLSDSHGFLYVPLLYSLYNGSTLYNSDLYSSVMGNVLSSLSKIKESEGDGKVKRSKLLASILRESLETLVVITNRMSDKGNVTSDASVQENVPTCNDTENEGKDKENESKDEKE